MGFNARHMRMVHVQRCEKCLALKHIHCHVSKHVLDKRVEKISTLRAVSMAPRVSSSQGRMNKKRENTNLHVYRKLGK